MGLRARPVAMRWCGLELLVLPLMPDASRQLLRAELLAVAIGFTTLGLGLAAGLLAAARRRADDGSLLYLALFAGGYGLRLLLSSTAAALLFAPPSGLWRYLLPAITYLLPVPALLFFRQVLGERGRRFLSCAWQINLLFAAAAVAYEAWRRAPWAASAANSLLMVLWLSVLLALLVRPCADADFHRLRLAFAVFGISVLGENLHSLGLRAWPAGIEPIGFLIFLGLLGSIVARRIFTGQSRLAAIEQEMETARRIQTAILPRTLPRVDGLDLAVRYIPAAAVAGDFYDFLGADARRLGVLVADVSGHGVPAALIASMIKVAAAAQTAHAAHPSQVLSEMSRIFYRQIDAHFITAACLHIDLDTGLLTHASAGHPPPLLRRGTGGEVSELRCDGLVMGRLGRATYTERSVDLRAGDTVLLYTDGWTEATGPAGEQFGDERLRRLLAAHGGGTAEALAAFLEEQLTAWTGGTAFADDLTLAVLRVDGKAQAGSAKAVGAGDGER
jgi:sigma-B regulation protein RsbU (phosphoserine phosphatase)